MIRTLEEDLQQLQKLGWRWERWARRERIILERTEPLTGLEPSRKRSRPFSDLRWVLEGGPLTRALRPFERCVLISVHNAGRRRAASVLGLSRTEMQEVLSGIERTLYKAHGEADHG